MTAYRIHLATSDDAVTWTRHRREPAGRRRLRGARPDGAARRRSLGPVLHRDQRRPMVAITSSPRSSRDDLVHWSDRRVVYTDVATGTFGGPTESPFVVARDGRYYLFIGPDWKTLMESFERDRPLRPAAYRRTRVHRERRPVPLRCRRPGGVRSTRTPPRSWSTSAGERGSATADGVRAACTSRRCAGRPARRASEHRRGLLVVAQLDVGERGGEVDDAAPAAARGSTRRRSRSSRRPVRRCPRSSRSRCRASIQPCAGHRVRRLVRGSSRFVVARKRDRPDLLDRHPQVRAEHDRVGHVPPVEADEVGNVAPARPARATCNGAPPYERVVRGPCPTRCRRSPRARCRRSSAARRRRRGTPSPRPRRTSAPSRSPARRRCSRGTGPGRRSRRRSRSRGACTVGFSRRNDTWR